MSETEHRMDGRHSGLSAVYYAWGWKSGRVYADFIHPYLTFRFTITLPQSHRRFSAVPFLGVT